MASKKKRKGDLARVTLYRETLQLGKNGIMMIAFDTNEI